MTQGAVLAKPASLKQIKYIANLAAQRHIVGRVTQPVEVIVNLATAIMKRLEVNPAADFDIAIKVTGITTRHASVAIDTLLKIRPEQKVSGTDTFAELQILLQGVSDGFYALPRKIDSVWDFFEVVTKKDGARWVNQLLGGNRKMLSIPMQSAAARAITSDWKAAALAFAERTKRCPKCHTRLTHPRSLVAKIGKKCAGDWGWPW